MLPLSLLKSNRFSFFVSVVLYLIEQYAIATTWTMLHGLVEKYTHTHHSIALKNTKHFYDVNDVVLCIFRPKSRKTFFISVPIHTFRLNANKSPINGLRTLMQFVHKTKTEFSSTFPSVVLKYITRDVAAYEDIRGKKGNTYKHKHTHIINRQICMHAEIHCIV